MSGWLYLKKITNVKILFTVLLCYFILCIGYNSLKYNKETKFIRPIRGSNKVSRRRPFKSTSSIRCSSGATSNVVRSYTSEDTSEDLTTTVHTTLSDTQEYVDKIFKDVYRPGFEISLPNLCPENGTSLAIVIIIISAPTNIAFRNVLRNTESYIPFGRQNNVPIAFMLGISNDTNINRLVSEESSHYKDIIINRNNDTYRNLSLKTMAVLEWFQTYCSKAAYILKVDDDIAVNVKMLLSFVKKRIHTQNAIYGRLAINELPIRSKEDKNYVPEKQYIKTHYPRYHYGSTYLMTSDVPAALYKAALSHKFMHVEDVFFTGIVAQQVGVRRVPAPEFLGFDAPKHWTYNKQNAISYYWDTSILKNYDEEYETAKKKWKEVTVPVDFEY